MPVVEVVSIRSLYEAANDYAGGNSLPQPHYGGLLLFQLVNVPYSHLLQLIGCFYELEERREKVRIRARSFPSDSGSLVVFATSDTDSSWP
jgi:hypothetical protein